MTYNEAIQYLYGLQLFGARPGLENTFALAALAGKPQARLRFIHVAGTNGKGSTCAMLESIYRTAGLKVGLFTSPHLVSFGERIQVNRQPINETDITRLTKQLQDWMQQFPQDSHPTFFEAVTVMALLYFEEQKCDLVIWETGLGGRLDATNIVTPLASVITNIQFDHQAWLGDTLARIASEKAGIIKPNVPVISAVDDPAAFRVLFETARQNHAPFWLITWAQTERPPVSEIRLPFFGEHQRLNAAVAVYAVKAVNPIIPVDDSCIQIGLSSAFWPGRMQLVEKPGGKHYLLDGAHNIAGARALSRAVKSYFAVRTPTLILGILKDKDCTAICHALAPLGTRILLVPVQSHRTEAPAALVTACQTANPAAEVLVCDSLQDGINRASQDEFVIITGSLYLIGEAMELLDLAPNKPANERGLNEWNAVRKTP